MKLVLAIVICSASSAAIVAMPTAEQKVRQVFAQHDCCGRLALSKIRNIGELRSGGHRLSAYELWFVNPRSSHGMKRLALVEGHRFVGSYLISYRATPSIAHNRIRFTCEAGISCNGNDLILKDGKPPAQLWLDGEVNVLEDTI